MKTIKNCKFIKKRDLVIWLVGAMSPIIYCLFSYVHSQSESGSGSKGEGISLRGGSKAVVAFHVVRQCAQAVEAAMKAFRQELLWCVSGQQSPSDIFAIGLASLAATRRRSGRGLLQGCVGWPPS